MWEGGSELYGRVAVICMCPTRTEAAVAIVKPLSVLKLAGSPAVLLKNFTSIPPTLLAVIWQ